MSDDYKEGYKAGYASGFSDGTGAGYSDAKHRAYLALDAVADSGKVDKQALKRVDEAVSRLVGKRQ
jgi:flagellar biosynthesis/type III secretory pathway protein FliH